MAENGQISKEQAEAEKLFRPIGEIYETASPLQPLWGSWLYRKAITSIVADPGAGKTTFVYKMSFQLAQGRPFLNIMPEEPVNILNIDLESSDSLVKNRINLVNHDGPLPDNITIYNAVDYYFNHIADVALDVCIEKKINLVILDNQTMAFATRDENDNSEAAKQMKFLRQWTNAANCAFILVHHTSKANMPGTRSGTGAYARARLADILINLSTPDPEDTSIIQFSVSKNRMTADDTVWYLKKNEGDFDFIEPPMIQGVHGSSNTALYQAQTAIMVLLADNKEHKLAEIVDRVSTGTISKDTVHNAVKRLSTNSRIVSPRYGFWQRFSIVET